MFDNNDNAFTGWDNSDTTDIFETAMPADENVDLLETIKKDDVVVQDDEKKVIEPKVPLVSKEEDLFATADGAKEEEVKDDLNKVVAKISSASMLAALKEKGLVSYELEDGVELNDDLADDILEDSFEEKFETFFEDKFKELDPAVKSIVKYSMEGGNIKDLLSKLMPSQGIVITEDMDVTDEKNQMSIIKRDRLEKGDDLETAQDYTNYLKESGKLQGIAEKLHAKFVEADKGVAKQEALRMSNLRKADKDRERDYRDNIQSFISTESDFNGMKFSKEDMRTYPSYIAENSIQLDNGKKISPLHNRIMEALKDPKQTLMLAKILKDDFKFTDISITERSKQVKDIKNNLQNQAPSVAVTTRKKRSLAEMLTD
jgi:hypothetical protein